MTGGRGSLLALLFLLHFLLPEAFKILILSFIRGSHYLMMDEISQVLHNRGHEVRMLLQTGILMIPGKGTFPRRPDTYQITTWSASQDYLKEYEKWFADYMEDFLKGRYYFIIIIMHNFLRSLTCLEKDLPFLIVKNTKFLFITVGIVKRAFKNRVFE
uniref:Uncharacterized protein n=1 Tax=Chelonoidis abingdonii TaxID=106734 RepID=A0A8C0JD03_CHEAB